MSLAPGARLGPYEIVELVGGGGMGEVYKGRDTRLDRVVAVKVLPQAMAAEPEHRARFEREARAVSQLNHRHVCTLFDVGREGDTDYLVMEYCEGGTLADLLARTASRTPAASSPGSGGAETAGAGARPRIGSPLPVQDTLRIGAELAEALGAAHRAGIVHRDLKPGNVMLTPGGVKVVDFGLAKPLPEAVAPLEWATLTRGANPLTAAGMLLGTIPYMAPEQVEGKEADARSDVFALGAILYEMATGRRAFEGATAASVAAAILDRQPEPVTALQPLAPPALEHVIATCLAKDPEARWQAAGDVARELRWIAAGPPPPARARGRRRFLWIQATVGAMAVAGLVLGAFALWRGGRGRMDHATVQAAVLHDGDGTLNPSPSNVVISPDGRRIAYVADEPSGTRLWVRDLAEASSRRLSDLDGAHLPFWSPDSRWVAFFTEEDSPRLWKIAAEGGSPVSLCPVTVGVGGTWNGDDVIVFAPTSGGPLYRVPAAGGSPEPVTALDTARHQTGHRMPWFLPDGDHFLFSTLPRVGADVEVYAGSLRSREVKRLLSSVSGATYAEPGYLLFVRDRQVVAQRFDPARLQLTGEPVPIGEPPHAEQRWDASWVASASRDGRLASLRSWPQRTELEWVDRSGRPQGKVPLPSGRWVELAVAPDGRSVIARRPVTATLIEVWLFDPQGLKAERVTPAQIMNSGLAWTADGRSFVYSSSRSGRFEIYVQKADGVSAAEMVPTVDSQFKTVGNATPDGTAVLIAAHDPSEGWRLWTAPFHGGRPALLPLPPPIRPTETAAAISPDGRWLAYISHESGQGELYVTSFPGAGARTRISTGGGWQPKWARGGRELLYLSRQGRDVGVMSVPIGAGPVLAAGAARVLVTRRGLASFAPSADGERLLLSVESGDTPPPYIALTLGWNAALEP